MSKSQPLFLKIFGVSGIALAIGLAGVLVWKAPEWQTNHIKNQISALRKIDEKDRVTLEKDRITLENATRSTLIQAFGGLFLVTTAYFSWQNLKATQRNLIASEEKQITERFSKAVEQLGNTNIHVRLGGIYALERISFDSERDYWQIIEILTAYVREKAPVRKVEENEKERSPISTDIQAVLTVLTRRAKAYGQGEENPLDLSKSNLRGADLRGAKLREAKLQEADLMDADLQEADLQGADLQEAKLQKANLMEANFGEANLQGANLQGAELVKANLMEAELVKANLQGAELVKANLMKANLMKAELVKANLMKANLQGANLMKANLMEANLQGAELVEANLMEANLVKANLQGANLLIANLWIANLTEANLMEADLKGADLKGADLMEANLKGADLMDADLKGADLKGADLKGANLHLAKNLTPEQVKIAKNWEDADYQEEFRALLGLPPKSKK